MKKQILLLLAALVCGVRTLLAVPAYPGRIVYTQPDGTKIVLERHGDEFGHWTTDAAGRTIRLHADGFFREVTDADPDDVRRQAASRRMRTASLARVLSWRRRIQRRIPSSMDWTPMLMRVTPRARSLRT